MFQFISDAYSIAAAYWFISLPVFLVTMGAMVVTTMKLEQR